VSCETSCLNWATGTTSTSPGSRTTPVTDGFIRQQSQLAEKAARSMDADDVLLAAIPLNDCHLPAEDDKEGSS
jgi:hypothetical protein